MSFWPFPRSLADALRRARNRGPVVEAGAGDGRLTQRIAEVVGEVWPLDLVSRPGLTRVQADARHLPVGPGRLGAVVMGNLARHLDPDSTVAMARSAWTSVAPGGMLAILEDEPEATSPREANYRQALRLLAVADPTRNPALAPEDLLDRIPAPWTDPHLERGLPNRERVLDPHAPVDWLRAHRPGPEVDALARDVAEHGMAYGPWWVARWERP